jgi:hypothetical protein
MNILIVDNKVNKSPVLRLLRGLTKNHNVNVFRIGKVIDEKLVNRFAAWANFIVYTKPEYKDLFCHMKCYHDIPHVFVELSKRTDFVLNQITEKVKTIVVVK